MPSRDKLFQIADSQQGYFTSRQAKECGFAAPNFHRYISSGEWEKITRGIYRLGRYPITNRPELVIWSLWSCNQQGKVQGIWSHETALDIYEFSDIMPAKMHLTVPKNFRKRASTPNFIILHHADLSQQNFIIQQGYRVTTPLQTLKDVVIENVLSKDLIVQAIRDALRGGSVSYRDLQNITELRRICDEENIRISSGFS